MLTFIGSFVALAVSRLRDRELETRSMREETLRNMRWAAELSASEKPRLATLGVAELEALLDSDLLEETEKVFVEAALGAVYEVAEEELDQLGDDAEAVLDTDERSTDDMQGEISSQPESQDGGDGDGKEGSRV